MLSNQERTEALERLRPWIERARIFSGWSFPAIFKVRPLDPWPPWDYESLVREYARDAQSVLDLGTGGGEFVAGMRDSLPARVVATEEWHVNAPIAYRRLAPLGADVVWARTLHLPFADETFDLVIDRHEELGPSEVARVLRPGGRVITQQVGPENWCELRAFFSSATAGNRSRIADFGDIRGEYASGFAEVGLRVTRNDSGAANVAYGELGELLFMLLITPWTIPDFNVDGDLEALLALERNRTTSDGLVMTWDRFLLVAEKAVNG
jgi:SAM-dependent methyltransferase